MFGETVSGLFVRKQQQVVAPGTEPALESDEHFLEERVLQVGVPFPSVKHDADELRPLHLQLPSRSGGRVVEVASDLEHALARLGADVRVAVEGALGRGD